MVDGDPMVVLRRKGEQREIDDPVEVELILLGGEDTEDIGAAQADAAEDFDDGLELEIGPEEQDVSGGETQALGERGFFGVAEELHDRRFPSVVVVAGVSDPGAGYSGDPGTGLAEAGYSGPLDVGEALGAELGFDPLFPFLELLLAEQRGRALGVEALDHPPAIDDGTKDLELRLAEDVGQIDELEAEAQVGLVGAEAVHGVGVGKAREGSGDVHPASFFEDPDEQALDERLDFHVGDEGGLDIDLRKLRLTVGAQVFIAEAAGDLEILLEAGDLQEFACTVAGPAGARRRCQG